MYTYMYIYIYIYMYIRNQDPTRDQTRQTAEQESRTSASGMDLAHRTMPNLPTNIVGFRGLDSSIMLCLREGILMSIGNFLESSSRAMLVAGIMLVGRLGVAAVWPQRHGPKQRRHPSDLEL